MESEIALLRRFAGTRDAEAFREIVRRHAGLVYGVALRILSDVDRASDVAQETFLQLTKDADMVSGSLPGWLHRVATHKAIDATQPASDGTVLQTESALDASRPAPGPGAPTTGNRDSPGGLSEASPWWSGTAQVGDGTDEVETVAKSQAKADQTAPETPVGEASTAGDPGDGFALASDPSAEPEDEQVEQTGGGMMGGGFYYYRYRPGKDSDDTNASSSDGLYRY